MTPRYITLGPVWDEVLTALAVKPTEPDYTGDPFAYKASATYNRALEVLLSKHRDYGPKNISESPGGPLNGLRVRMWDKLARINNLVDSGAQPENESLRDSFLDLLNYSAIALLVLDGDWPE
jgi:hypothetical protein